MMGERLPPSVENGDEAELATEMPGIGGDGLQCLGDGFEQYAIDQRLVLIRDRRDLRRHREHDVEIWHRQQIGLTGDEPLLARGTLALGTMTIATGV